jgi:hypothetical protein
MDGAERARGRQCQRAAQVGTTAIPTARVTGVRGKQPVHGRPGKAVVKRQKRGEVGRVILATSPTGLTLANLSYRRGQLLRKSPWLISKLSSVPVSGIVARAQRRR